MIEMTDKKAKKLLRREFDFAKVFSVAVFNLFVKKGLDEHSRILGKNGKEVK